MTDFKFCLDAMPEDQRRYVQKLNNIFSPIPITVTDQAMIIGFGDQAEETAVWRDLYRAHGHTAHCV